MKLYKIIPSIFILSNILLSQDATLCPPRFLDAYFYDEEVYLVWEDPDSSNFGTILFDECFLSCSLAIEPMNIEHLIDNESGGWFRTSEGDTSNCGTGMRACSDDGNDDTYSAIAYWSSTDSVIDSRMYTNAIDLSSYSAAHLEFYEGYSYPEDQHDSNMVEISADGGSTWDVLHYSDSFVIRDTVTYRLIDISAYAGQQVHIGFRYLDNLGNGEGWYIDDIRVWGGDGTESSLCGTFQSYEVLVDGVSAGVTTDTDYSVTGLENGIEYCFEIAAVYEEGTSAPCLEDCAVPMGPFIIEPTTVNFPELNSGDYMQSSSYFLNFDTLNLDFSIFAAPVADLVAYPDLLADDFETDDFAQSIIGTAFHDTTELGTLIIGWWEHGDSSTATSTYLTYYTPEDGGSFAYLNDDAIGDGFDFNTEDALMFSDPVDVPDLSFGPVYLMTDILFPQPDGPCWMDDLYSEFAQILVTTDEGCVDDLSDTPCDSASWQVVDSTFTTGWYWASHMYNITPMIEGGTSFRVGFTYDDCGGNWGYGIGIDNVKIKHGDDFTWLSISPYKGKTSFFGGYNDTVEITIGAYSTYDGFDDGETAYISYGVNLENLATMSINTGVVMSSDDDVIPGVFKLHQNYPNPFNPETMIQFDVPQRVDLTLSVYDLLGRRVKTLVKDNLDIGSYNVKWNGSSDAGEMLPSGMYFYELQSSKFHSVKKLILVK